MIRVEVVCAWPERCWRIELELPEGSRVDDALAASAWRARVVDAEAGVKVGIYGKVVAGSQVLQDGDRIELYRPLRADPKEARRRRAAGQA
jgi:putative ubiquitin-RnfH superfamily antitoxin RatB of RatAB toxin-antitoxin module